MAVIKLNRRVDYAPHISPICLPPKVTPTDRDRLTSRVQDMHLLGHYGWASGWGALEPGSRLRPKTLQVGKIFKIQKQHIQYTTCYSRSLMFR